ncbi:unnamed protein product [Urochloa decumbens]|uniref:Uncharacterized protein n=1 Tax=Urochloa decumbens TaxID=240449 RepID=A0ABC9G1P2_9POAL
MDSASRPLRATTPPSTPAGDPPAAAHPTSTPAGDPPAANRASASRHAPTERTPDSRHCSRAGSGEALELHYCSSGSTSSSPVQENLKKAEPCAKKDVRGKGPALETELAPGRSPSQPAASYKEALVGARTFKPRFDTSRRPDEWCDNSARQRLCSGRPSVWGRLGPRVSSVHDRLGSRVPLGQQDINGFLQILKTKALTCDVVHRDALQQLRIPPQDLQVSRISTSAFLLRFDSLMLRNRAYALRKLDVGRTSLHLMPWGRQFGAANALGNLFYRARVCFEGVPDHAHQVDSILHLLPSQSLVEGIDYVREKEDEKGCFIVWIWCKDPDSISVLGTLQLEEPVAPPEGYDDDDARSAAVLRADALSMLCYEVLIHLDRVEDYNPPTSSPSFGSYDSDISGIPGDERMGEWPLRHRFDWHLGQPDAIPDPPRASVHSRLGGRRDRSPPRDGGAGGFYQIPPPNQFDLGRSSFGGAGGADPNNNRNNAGGGYQGRRRQHEVPVNTKEDRVDAGSGSVPVTRQDLGKDQGSDLDAVLQAVPARRAFADIDGRKFADPMLDEAVQIQGCQLQGKTMFGNATAMAQSGLIDLEEPIPRSASVVHDRVAELVQELGVQRETLHEFEHFAVTNPVQHQLEMQGDVVRKTDKEVLPMGAAVDIPTNANPMQNHWATEDMPTMTRVAGTSASAQGEQHDLPQGPLNVFRELPFDLNLGSDPFEELNNVEHGMPIGTCRRRDGRTSTRREGKESMGNKQVARGLTCFAVPLKKALLCTPTMRPKIISTKKTSTESTIDNVGPTRRLKNVSTAALGQSIDDQATAFLLKASGDAAEDGEVTELAKENFGNRFVDSLQEAMVDDMRKAFGLPEGGADRLGAIAINAEA